MKPPLGSGHHILAELEWPLVNYKVQTLHWIYLLLYLDWKQSPRLYNCLAYLNRWDQSYSLWSYWWDYGVWDRCENTCGGLRKLFSTGQSWIITDAISIEIEWYRISSNAFDLIWHVYGTTPVLVTSPCFCTVYNKLICFTRKDWP